MHSLLDNRNQKLLTSLVLSAVLFGAVPAFSQAAPQANVNAAAVQTQSAQKAPALANEEKEFAAEPHIAEVDVDGGHVQGYVLMMKNMQTRPMPAFTI